MLTLPKRSEAPTGFQIFSGALQALEAEGRKVIHTTASSAVELLNGDEITEGCIKDMVAQAQSGGMTIFLNHSYKVPEDVFGSTTGADLVMRVGEFGTAIADMDLDVSLDESNPRAVQTYESIKNGTKIGVSIGCDIVEWEFRDPKARFDGGVRFKKMKLLEASLVGIPKNPRGWVHSAIMALHSATEAEPFIDDLPEEGPELILESHPELPDSAFAAIDSDGRHYPHHHKDGSIWLSLLRNALARVADPGNTQAGKGHLMRHAKEYGIGDNAAEPETTESTEVPGDTVPNTGSEDAVSTIEPAEEPALQVDLPTASTPGDEPEETNDASPEKTTSLAEVNDVAQTLALSGADRVVVEMVLSTLEHAASELTAARSQVASLTTERDQALTERDKALTDLTEAVAIVERLARLPLGRKTAFAGPIRTFQARFAGIYDPAYLKLIDERSKED